MNYLKQCDLHIIGLLAPNGLRYLRGGGALSKWGWDKLRQRNYLKTPQNPPRQVHALLGNLPPTKTPIEKRRRRQRAEFLHTTQSLAMSKKQNLPKPN